MKKPLAITLVASYAVFLAVVIPLLAADPAWWTDSGNNTAFIDGSVSNSTANNYKPLSVGQLKNVASKAKIYLDLRLNSVGGSGANITALVNGFTANATENYLPANLGQLKAVATPFYDRLHGLGYNTTLNLSQRGGWGNWTADYYAWNPSTPTAGNYVPANLGQVKMVFSFDVSANNTVGFGGSSNTWGIPDYWLINYGLNPADPNIGTEDADGDGIDNYQEYLNGTNPTVKDAPPVGLIVLTPLQ